MTDNPSTIGLGKGWRRYTRNDGFEGLGLPFPVRDLDFRFGSTNGYWYPRETNCNVPAHLRGLSTVVRNCLPYICSLFWL